MSENSNDSFFGVFDGHRNFYISHILSNVLHKYLSSNINNLS